MITYIPFMIFSIISSFLICTGTNGTQTITINITGNQSHICLGAEQETFSTNVAKLIEFINKKGYHVTFGEAYRTHEQALIYAHEGLGIKNSLHCERLAIDLNIFDNSNRMLSTVEECRQFGDYWESLHPFNVWGGRWIHRPDFDHYQMTDER